MTWRDKLSVLKVSHVMVSAICLMAIGMACVWCHVSVTKINYRIAEELQRRDLLREETKRLKIEIATLKSPQRIETIARNELELNYPGKEQVIFLR